MQHCQEEPVKNMMKPNRHKKKVVFICLASVVGVLIIVGAIVFTLIQQGKLANPWRSANTFANGVTVEGIDLGGKTMEQAKDALADAEKQKTSGYRFELKYQDQTFTVSDQDFKVTCNTDEVLQEAIKATKAENFSLSTTVDQSTLKTALENAVAPLNKEAKDAQAKSFNPSSGKVVCDAAQTGVEVQNDQVFQDVQKILDEGNKTGSVTLTVKTVDPQVTADDIQKNTVKLGTFSTVSTNNANGTFNMARALATANGTVIQGGGTFSFLNTVGACDEAAGYKPAGAIVDGKVVDSYGGGICQASTTIYGAALRSGCDITIRYNHTYASSYVPLGLDATVSWPSADLQFKNPTKYPMFIVSGSNGNTMFCTIYGYNDGTWDNIKVSSWQASKDEKGAVVANAQRTYYKNGAEVRTEQLPSSYYSNKEAASSGSAETNNDVENNTSQTQQPSVGTAGAVSQSSNNNAGPSSSDTVSSTKPPQGQSSSASKSSSVSQSSKVA
ncbi:MAG: VanW family protein [Oscillospiraceae bacterium]|jgi:vancomycin resistance protein YoaR